MIQQAVTGRGILMVLSTVAITVSAAAIGISAYGLYEATSNRSFSCTGTVVTGIDTGSQTAQGTCTYADGTVCTYKTTFSTVSGSSSQQQKC